MYEWGSKLYHGTIITTEPHIVYRHAGINSISTSAWSTIALLEDNTIVGWGYNAQDQLGTDRATHISSDAPATFTIPEAITKIYMTTFHTVALSSSGHAFFWGCCTQINTLKAEGLKAAIGSVDNISDIAIAKRDDNIFPDVFLKHDGSVWLAYAPAPSNTEQCQTTRKLYDYHAPSYHLTGMTVPAVKIVNGGDGNTKFTTIALGSDNSLWGANTRHPQKGFVKIPLKSNQ